MDFAEIMKKIAVYDLHTSAFVFRAHKKTEAVEVELSNLAQCD